MPMMFWVDEKAGAYGLESETSGQNGDVKAENLTVDSTLKIAVLNLGTGAQTTFKNLPAIRFLADGTVDVITTFSSDGRIARYGLKLLADPKGALPPYDAVLLARTNADPRLLAALKPLLGAISLPRMQAANLQVDRTDNKQTPAQAAAWLDAQLAPP